ncbi:kelch-like protein 12 [Corythoichthys intestinalis]|uniref:kelch-like protein 12 n=1 Tax=Corythoichthys intestinalis TaxID=161448 RepID=UPI0025A6383B|nr:kelch-like protein 12 [Corythoichthys intestinalis]XP_057695825.1 kelch-like protein 12 [Corythoichthys intestinalis]XP_061796948.1 kelch-like protein 12 [Nerophis lumbriciformis]
MNALRGGTVTWRPQPWQDGDGREGEPLSDSDSEEEDFPDDSTTPLGDYITLGIKQLLDAQQLCDVTLLVEGRKFLCHRVLLAAVSPYFRAMFTSPLVESRLTEIRLEEVTPSVMETVIQFVYTGEAGLSLETAEDLFVAANRLQVMPLQDLCSRFLFEHLSVDNCLGMYSLARSHHDQLLLRASLRLVAHHFPRVSRHKDFLLLDQGTLGSLLSSDRLGVDSEAEVYDAARRWAEHHPLDRYAHMPALLHHLRPGLLSQEESRRLSQELGPAAAGEGLGGPLRPREGMFEKKIVCIALTQKEDDQLAAQDYTMDCFDPRTGRWEKLAPLGSLVSPGCTAVGERLFVAGGILGTGSVSSAVHEYDAVLDRWTERPSMAVPRCMLGLVGCGGLLYALGGSNRSALLDSSETLKLATLRWAPGPRLPLPLRAFACATLRGRLYLLGGTTVEQNRAVVHSGVLIYHTLTDCWTRVALDSGATCLAGGVAVRGGVCAIGGYIRDTTKFLDGNYTNLETLDATGRVLFFREGRAFGDEREVTGGGVTISADQRAGAGRGSDRALSPVVFPGLPRRIAAGGVARWKRRIYVLGGENGSRFYDSVYCWKPGWRSWVQRREKLPGDTGGVSQFGCTTLKFPKKHILFRLRRAKENCVLHE